MKTILGSVLRTCITAGMENPRLTRSIAIPTLQEWPLNPSPKPAAIAAALIRRPMELEDVVQVECSAGCGHRLYSDRGQPEYPCHWPAARVAAVTRVLDLQLRVGSG